MKYIIVAIMFTLLIWAVNRDEERTDRHVSNLQGHSMEPWLMDGQRVYVYHVSPKEGDMVSFRCTNEKCPQINMVKHLTEKSGDCYWFEGRPDQWRNEDGEIKKSLDSRTFGWVCQDDIVINGVVKPICEDLYENTRTL